MKGKQTRGVGRMRVGNIFFNSTIKLTKQTEENTNHTNNLHPTHKTLYKINSFPYATKSKNKNNIVHNNLPQNKLLLPDIPILPPSPSNNPPNNSPNDPTNNSLAPPPSPTSSPPSPSSSPLSNPSPPSSSSSPSSSPSSSLSSSLQQEIVFHDEDFDSVKTKEEYNLRPYQSECVEACINAWKNNLIDGRRQLVSLPVGSGKTVIFAEVIRRLLEIDDVNAPPSAKKFLFLVHRQELIDQAFRSFDFIY